MPTTHTVPAAALFLALLAAPACKDDDEPSDDSGTPDPSAHAQVEIVSPSDGASFGQGDEVLLEVSVTDQESGEPMEHGAVTWSAPEGWSFTGDSGAVSDLPVGSYPLEVSVVIGERTLTDSVDVTVIEVHDPVHYAGQLRSRIYLYSNEYDIDDEGPCDGTFEIDTDASWGVVGSGQCHVSLFHGMVDWDVIFEIDGVRTDGSIAGTLFFFDDQGTRYETPYEGTVDDAAVSATFAAEHSNDHGILRFSGSLDGRAMP